MKFHIKDVCIVTMDDETGIIENGYICIEDDLISFVGEKLPEDFVQSRCIDGKNKVAIPGLINSHTHSPMTLLRSFADDLALQDWLFNHIFPAEEKLTAEDVYWGSKLAIMEMIASGTTCFADMYCFMDKVAQAVEESGIRAHISRGLVNKEVNIDIEKDNALQENISLFKDWNNAANGRIKVGFAPHACYTCSPEYIWSVAEVARKYGASIHIHLDETLKEHSDCIDSYEKTPTRQFYDLGIFDLPTIAAHCVHITDEDMDLLVEKGVNVAYNPTSNLKLGSGIAPVVKMIEKGINVALGTDGTASNNNLDMFEEINLSALINKGVSMLPEVIPAYMSLKMATVNGAKALGMEKTGILKKGYKADIVVVNFDRPHLIPQYNVISSLVYSAKGADVETVIVDGKVLYYKGEYKTLDYEEIRFEVNKIAKKFII